MIRRSYRLVAGVFVGMLLIYAGFAVFTARLAVFPWWYKPQFVGSALPGCTTYQRRVYVHCDDPQKSLNLHFTSFEAEHAMPDHPEPVRVTGWWVDAPADKADIGTFILVHGGGADRRAMLKHVDYLHKAGFHVLLIDCTNHGLTKGNGRGLSFGYYESQSVIAAAEWAQRYLKGNNPKPIFVFGTSQGAFAALLAAAESPLINGVIAENPYISVSRLLREFPALEWMPKFIREGALKLVGFWIGTPLSALDVRAFADQLQNKPVFLIHSKADAVVNVRQSQEIYDLLKGPKELWLPEQGEHEAIWNENPKEYERRVLKFMAGVMQPFLDELRKSR